MAKKKSNAGRPPKYKTAEELQKKIEEYFDWWYRTKEVVRKIGKDKYEVYHKPMITITDLVLFLWFSDRHSFYDYEKRPEFSHTIKRARTFIEREYEELAQMWLTTAIFALKNFWRTDKQEIEHSGDLDIKVKLPPKE